MDRKSVSTPLFFFYSALTSVAVGFGSIYACNAAGVYI